MRKCFRLQKTVLLRTFFTLGLLVLFLSGSGIAQASNKPTTSATLLAGPYLIDVNLSQDTPFTDQPFQVTVMPHTSNVQLSGLLVAEPGLGTDATNLQTRLTSDTATHDTMSGWLHLPVQGAWRLVINLNGTQGPGKANLAITVAAPGAIPVWLAWLIALAPLIFFAVWVYQQRGYRRKLLAEKEFLV